MKVKMTVEIERTDPELRNIRHITMCASFMVYNTHREE